MGTFCNKRLIEYLGDRIGTNVVLYTADSYAFYGKLARITCDGLGTLAPGNGQTFVVVRHPDQTFSSQGTSAEFELLTLVDLCTVVAATTGLTQIPPGFTFCPPLDDLVP